MGATQKASGIQALIDRAYRFFDQGLWDIELAGLPTFRAIGVKATRILSLAWQGMVQNECTTRASALTYISVLSLVPLLALAFSVAKGFGAYEYLVAHTITPALDQLAPVSEASAWHCFSRSASGQSAFGATTRKSMPNRAAPTVREFPMLKRASPR